MPSQDNSLDELLREMTEDEEELPVGQEAKTPEIDDLSELSEAEIARLLSAGTKEKKENVSRQEDTYQKDVLSMLDGTEDRELQEIQGLLEKSDRSETIAEDSFNSRGSGGDDNPVDRLLADIEEAGENVVAGDVTDGKSSRALEREQRRQEKAAKKEAKKQEKQTGKEKKENKKKENRKKENKEKNKKIGIQENTRSQDKESGAAEEYDVMLDKDLLDSIVSGAGHVGQQDREDRSESLVTAAEQAEEAGSFGDLLSYAQADLDSAEGSEAEWTENRNQSPELDIMTLDASEVDALIDEKPSDGDGSKKEGLLSRMFSFLTEEDEAEAENEDVKLSEENEEILRNLDEEKQKKKGGAKKAKKKKPAKKEKKAKPKKPPKPKKEKKPKQEEPYPLGKKLTFKKALPLIVFGISLGTVIFLLTSLTVDYADKQAASAAYKEGDYEACYRNLFGKKLNENEAIMFGRSESILHIRLWVLEYEMLAEDGAETEALDSLIQTVTAYPDLYQYAAQWNAGSDVYEIYLDVIDILYSKYGLTEAQALEIAAVKSDLEYTRIVNAVAQGHSYENWKSFYGAADGNRPEEEQHDPEESGSEGSVIPEGGDDMPETDSPSGEISEDLEDRLPEEEEIEDGEFIEN